MSARSNFLSNIATAVIVAVIAYFAYTMRNVVLLACGAAICAVASQPLIERLQRVEVGNWRPGPISSIMMVMLGLAEIALMLAAFAPATLGWVEHSLLSWQLAYTSAIADWLGQIPAAPAETVRGYVARATAVILIWLVLAIFLRRYGRRIVRRGSSIIPPPRRPGVLAAFERIIENNDEWLVREITLMLTAGVSSFMALGLIGVKYFYALALMAGVASLFPPVGLMLATLVCALIAGADSMFKLLGVLSFFAIYSEMESAYLRPRLNDGRVALPLLALIVALMLGMSTAGLAGSMIALPIATVTSIIVGGYVMRSPAAAIPLDPFAACELRQLRESSQHPLVPAIVASEPEAIDVAPVAIAPPMSPWLGKIALMLANGAASLFILKLLDVQYAYALAGVVAVGDIIPVFGPVSAVLLCAIVAGAESTVKVVAILGFFAVYPQIEASFFAPRVESRGFVTALAIVAAGVIIGIFAWGIPGALIAIPISISAAIVLANRLGPTRGEAALRVVGERISNATPVDYAQ